LPELKIVVDRTRCTGIGICESIAPGHFEVGDDGALILIDENFTAADREDVETAVRSCPAKALKLETVK
jgi:ferredoxin